MEKKTNLDKTVEVKIKQKKVKSSSHKKNVAKTILIVELLVILIPCAIFGFILIKAFAKTGSPVDGQRFENALDPAIETEDIQSLQTSLSSITGIEKADINLTTGQLRVTLDAEDGLSSDEIKKIAEKAYSNVNSKLPISKYFTNSSSKRMYDLSISVYNFADDTKEGMICWVVQKNGQMAEPVYSEPTVPIDEDLAKELRGEKTEETPDVIGELADGEQIEEGAEQLNEESE